MHLIGDIAFSDFKMQQLQQKARASFPNLKIFEARFIYFVEHGKPLLPVEKAQLEKLLRASFDACEMLEHPSQVRHFYIVPRFGTISPWSSKATDIAKNCELRMVDRLERGIVITLDDNITSDTPAYDAFINGLHDRMTEMICHDVEETDQIFQHAKPEPLNTIDILQNGYAALVQANDALGLALSDDEKNYLFEVYQGLQRNPTDAELMMFAQVNSEHCRHKIFNADWIINGEKQTKSLFAMIKNTYAKNPDGILVAYDDNAAVSQGFTADRWFVNPKTKHYALVNEPIHTVMKVETHNHPTAISPFAGAATGAGGEIRDEAATGRGAQSKAGLVGFSTSHLRIPHFTQPWEVHAGKPENIESALQIMLAGPIGAASFNNEFGRPNLCGYFRTYEQAIVENEKTIWRGYHKPIMLAGGMGNIREPHVKKQQLTPGASLIVLGGPAMQIGLGGGAASSKASGHGDAELDFASVQRSNPEMQRRCQEVINHCWALGDENPILFIHDVGAGGLSNALPELVHDSDMGGLFQLRDIDCADTAMSPLAIWCNESQERYVMGIAPESEALFEQIAARERCPYAIVGRTTPEQNITLNDTVFNNKSVDLSHDVLFAKPPRLTRDVQRSAQKHTALVLDNIDLVDAAKRVLQLPAVASKNFLITIGDRSVGGLVARDQMVGPWQVPVADAAVTAMSYTSHVGEAMAMGERAPLSLINPAASARMAVAEAITNIACSAIDKISDISLSANWMAAAGYEADNPGLYDMVEAIGMELCPQLGIAIPVGKDSLSMRSVWQDESKEQAVISPLSVIISAFAPVSDIRKSLTPQLRTDQGETELLFIDLAAGKQRLGASALAQVYQQLGDESPDVVDANLVKQFFSAKQRLSQANLLLAYHDRSDGGLLATLCEMAFAGHTGLTIDSDALGKDLLSSLFNEELGVVIQVKSEQKAKVLSVFSEFRLEQHVHAIGTLNQDDKIYFMQNGQPVLSATRQQWQRDWSESSYRMQALRDNPACAQQEFDAFLQDDPGLQANLTFKIAVPAINTGAKPKVAILREQGVNGQNEMAAAFHFAGFEAIDVHMSDIIAGHCDLKDIAVLAACGGFSYGDVLGAGRGWANNILFHEKAKEVFARYFARSDTLTLGVCNGCQMLAHLRDIIPGAAHWPYFTANQSAQFEARLSRVIVNKSNSIFLRDMAGSELPISVAHGEGQATWKLNDEFKAFKKSNLMALQYLDNHGNITENFPANPNGSPEGITGVTTIDGRVTIMMPHPERVFRTVQYSWHPDEWGEYGPWMALFINARKAL